MLQKPHNILLTPSYFQYLNQVHQFLAFSVIKLLNFLEISLFVFDVRHSHVFKDCSICTAHPTVWFIARAADARNMSGNLNVFPCQYFLIILATVVRAAQGGPHLVKRQLSAKLYLHAFDWQIGSFRL